MKNSHFQWLGGLILISLAALTFQNCGKFRPIESGSLDSSSLSGFTAQDVANLLKPNIVDDCWSNPSYNACIFWKNPVAQIGSPFPSDITRSTNLSQFQHHAVNVYGYDNSGRLSNKSMTVFSYNERTRKYESLSTQSRKFKFPYENDPEHRFSQVMAYHWLMTLGVYMKVHGGGYYAEDKDIDVLAYIPDEENAFWDPQSNQIQIGSTPSGNQLALSAEVYAHEAGHANAHYATQGLIYETVGSGQGKSEVCAYLDDPDTAKVEAVPDGVCCKNDQGCSWAIDEGQADYHYAVLFPNDTDMLESYKNSNRGIRECGLTRSLEENITLTSPKSYNNACGEPEHGTGDYKGEVHVMGRVYASIWWFVRGRANNPHDIDALFTAHLAALEGRDDFRTALDKILSTDNALFGGKYSNLFSQEFARRGIF